jgi:hypothetical protein
MDRDNKTQPLIPGRLLFRFAVPCLYRDPLWTDADAALLDEDCRLAGLGELEGRIEWAEVRAAWSEMGLAFAACVRKKGTKKGISPISAQHVVPEHADGLHLWIDTRDVHNVHRAGRFCHRITVPLSGTGQVANLSDIEQPARGKKHYFAEKKVLAPMMLPINRAKELPRPAPPGSLRAYCQTTADGYTIEAMIAAEALTGFDPAEHPRLGFTYAVIDRELGQQTFAVGPQMPYQEDPSLWATLELVK